MRLSKSKIMAYRQCPKRLWLEVNHPEKREDSQAAEASFRLGDEASLAAQKYYDPKQKGTIIARGKNFESAIVRSQALLSAPKSAPIFEAAIATDQTLAFVDVMRPAHHGKKIWDLIEVKASTSVKEYHRDDVAFQAFVAKAIDLSVNKVILAHINNQFIYPGRQDYEGLFTEADLTQEAFSREAEVKEWVKESQSIAKQKDMPDIQTGPHCHDPYECGFFKFCQSQEEQADYPIDWLPRKSANLKDEIETKGIKSMNDVPDAWLNEKQKRVKAYTISGEAFFDKEKSAKTLAGYEPPYYFLDFETINFAVPIWAGARPYQQIPFQFSLHAFSKENILWHTEFLDLSGDDPAYPLARELVLGCSLSGPIFAYNAPFEKKCIKGLAERFEEFDEALMSIHDRIIDLLPIARDCYYHPNQEGSWSLKKVLPTIDQEMNYQKLDVQGGDMAMEAYREAIHVDTDQERKEEIRKQLLEYCKQDTLALIQLWKFFSGR